MHGMFQQLKSIVKHTSIYGIGDLLSRAIAFVLIPFYTHYLSTEEYGTLELLDLTGYVVAMILATGIAEAVLRYYYNYDDEIKRKQVISTAIIALWANCLVGVPILLLLAGSISRLVFESPEYYRLFQIMFISTAVGLTNEVPRIYLRIQKKSVLYVAVSMARLVINLTLNIVFIAKFKMGVSGVLYGGLISVIVAGVFLTLYTLRRIPLSFSIIILKEMIVYGLPMVGNWVGMFVLHFGNRFLLQRLTSLSEVGIFGLAYKFGMVLNFLVLTPFLNIWRPKQFEIVEEPDAKNVFATFFTYFCFVVVFLGLGLSTIIEDVIRVMADPQYHAAYQYVPVLVLANIFFMAYWFTQLGILLEKKTKYLGLAAILSALINIGGNLLLIPRYGAWGATVTTLVSFVFFFAFTTYYGQKFYAIPYQLGRLIKMAGTAAGLYIIAGAINPESAAVSISLKALVALCFPLVLYGLRFYSPEELAKLHELAKGLVGRLKR